MGLTRVVPSGFKEIKAICTYPLPVASSIIFSFLTWQFPNLIISWIVMKFSDCKQSKEFKEYRARRYDIRQMVNEGRTVKSVLIIIPWERKLQRWLHNVRHS